MSLTGSGATFSTSSSDVTLTTLTDKDEQAVKLDDTSLQSRLVGTTITVTGDPGTGISNIITAYDHSAKKATVQNGWHLPDNTSSFSITTSDEKTTYHGGIATLSGPDITLTNLIAPDGTDQAGTPGLDVSLKNAKIVITNGLGTGLSGIITTYTSADKKAILATAWSAPNAASTFSIAKQTTYTIVAAPNQLYIYLNSSDPSLLIQYRIDQLDTIISTQLSVIMHDSNFQSLESSWRGLHYLVFNSETGTRLKLRLLNVAREELKNDLDNAVEFDQSTLFKKVYEAEYGMFGGSPYSALLGDFYFGRNPQEVNLLEKISNVAAAAHAPFITAADPKLFDMEHFTVLDKPRDLATLFESAELIKWRAFRDSEDSRYVALTMPHVLMRLPYGPATNPVDEFNFVEDVVTDDGDLDKFLWGNAAWFLGQRITNAFSLYSWTAAIRGYEGGGLVTDMPIYTFKTDDGQIAVRVPTEVAITDRREKELSDLGFIALCYRKETDQAAFFGGQTANKPKVYIEDSATANARLSAQLPYMLAASRFAHYIKVLMRDRIGSFMSQGDVSRLLNRWISQYVLLDDVASQELKARYPLREARIDVTANPAKPGAYKAIVFLRPHFQLEELTVSIRLVAELPPPVGG
ncbi:MAG: type VI secretion system contractile sheath large subunit [Oscillochloris sp.]|nr:type VI secretion system contractile sheath large subunit [Oscillochloris sp.]